MQLHHAFDRSDIQDLIQSMDDAIDMMNKTVKTVALFEQTTFEPGMREMGDVIAEAAQLVAEAIPLLARPGANRPASSRSQARGDAGRGRADELHEAGLKELFRRHGHADPHVLHDRRPALWRARRSSTGSRTSPTRSAASSSKTLMDAALAFPVLVALIAVALFFDFLNGLHDAANSIATIVSTRVLRPQYAVFWAAFFNFIAFLFFGLHVAETLGSGIVECWVVDRGSSSAR